MTKTRPERDPETMSMQAHHMGEVGASPDVQEKHKQMSNFITSMAKNDKALYDRMIALMKLFQITELDLKKL